MLRCCGISWVSLLILFFSEDRHKKENTYELTSKHHDLKKSARLQTEFSEQIFSLSPTTDEYPS